jgi:hypothetical protein
VVLVRGVEHEQFEINLQPNNLEAETNLLE